MKSALIVALAAMVVVPLPASGDVFSSKNRASLFNSQKQLLDSRAANQYKNSVRLQPPQVITPSKWGTPGDAGNYDGPYLDLARDAARRHGVPEGLFVRLVRQESGWNARARSHKGALGLAQLMPGTARALGVDPLDPVQNLDGGARYLVTQFRKFGTWRLALAAYNAGPGAVEKYGGIPPFRETRDYVRIITGTAQN